MTFAADQLATSCLFFVPLTECSGEHQDHKKTALVSVGSTGHLFKQPPTFVCCQPCSTFILDPSGQETLSFPGEFHSVCLDQAAALQDNHQQYQIPFGPDLLPPTNQLAIVYTELCMWTVTKLDSSAWWDNSALQCQP